MRLLCYFSSWSLAFLSFLSWKTLAQADACDILSRPNKDDKLLTAR